MVWHEQCFMPNDCKITFKYTILNVYGNSEGSQLPSEDMDTKAVYALTSI
jgi:hypothetical protein